MKKQFLFIFTITALSVSPLLGQGSLFGLSYTASLPMGETQEFTDATSWRGASLEWRWFLQENISAGIFFGWNVFHEKESGDFIQGDIAFAGTQLRTVNAFPMLLTGHYYFGDDEALRPYLGLGLGTYRTQQRTTVGILQVDNDNWQWGISPSIGATVPMGYSGLMGNIEVRYNYAPKGGDSLTHSYLGISLGLAWSQY